MSRCSFHSRHMFHSLMEKIDDVKEKLTEGEYQNLVKEVSDLRPQKRLYKLSFRYQRRRRCLCENAKSCPDSIRTFHEDESFTSIYEVRLISMYDAPEQDQDPEPHFTGYSDIEAFHRNSSISPLLLSQIEHGISERGYFVIQYDGDGPCLFDSNGELSEQWQEIMVFRCEKIV